MKIQTILLMPAVIFLFSCAKKDPFDVNQYYAKPAQDSILTQVVAHLLIVSEKVPARERLSSRYHGFYSKEARNYSIGKYFISERDSTHYFYVVRPTTYSNGKKRGVGGKLKIDKDLHITSLEEVFVTPLLSDEEVKIKGDFLFPELVKGNIDKFLKMKTYVEWPDERTEYDTSRHEWRINERD
jgi:hypothetical protein